MPGRLSVLVNGKSGGGHDESAARDIAARLRAAGADAQVQVVPSGELLDRLKAAAAARPERLVVAGGDGTMNAAASVLAGSDTALGVLPLGTLNHFARDLGIADLDAALKAALDGKVRRIDVGEVNGRVFVNNSSIGLYPAMVHRREKQQRRLGRSKWHAMLWAAAGVLRRHPFLDLELELGREARRRRTPFVFVGNNVYRMQGFDIGARERMDAGVLSLYLAHRTGRLGLVLLALRALVGRLYDGDDFEAATSARLRIEGRRHKRLLVARDGEVEAMDLPLEYRIRPGALRVLVP